MLRPELKQRTLTAERVVKILSENGTEITIEEAKIMLDFLTRFVKLALDQQTQES